MSARIVWPSVALAVGLAAGFTACERAPDPRAQVVATWVEGLAVPGHRAFADAAQALADEAAAACDAGDVDAFDAVRDAWSAAHGRWHALQTFAFGPYDAYPERLGPHIDFRPIRPDRIAERLADPPTVDDIDGLGAAERGLPAIEYLLWTAEAPWPGARCQYLVAATADTARLAEALHRAWADGFAAELTAPDGDPFVDADAAFSALLNRMGDRVLVLRDDALGRPLGDKAGGVPQPDLVSAPFSGRSLADLEDALDGLRAMYLGVDGRPGLAAMPAIVDRRSADAAPDGRTVDVDGAFHQAWAEARAAVGAIDRPLRDAVVETPAAVRAAIDALGRLQTVLQVDITGVLAVELAFGSGDGD